MTMRVSREAYAPGQHWLMAMKGDPRAAHSPGQHSLMTMKMSRTARSHSQHSLMTMKVSRAARSPGQHWLMTMKVSRAACSPGQHRLMTMKVSRAARSPGQQYVHEDVRMQHTHLASTGLQLSRCQGQRIYLASSHNWEGVRVMMHSPGKHWVMIVKV